jgi:non-ribosomal peptide synthetase component F
VEYPVSKLDLTFFFREGKEIRTEIEYRTELFDEPAIRQLAKDYLTLLVRLLDNPEMTIRQLKDTLKSSVEISEQQEFTAMVMRPVEQEF